MKSPKLSVIIPVYNVEMYLSRCLDSIVKQTLKDIEIICVNDGSTDDSLKILKKYAKKDNRIKIVSQENMGLSEARNNALKIAKGEFVGFIDSDDWVDLDFFEVLLNLAEKENSDIVMAGMKHVDESGVSGNTTPNFTADSFTRKVDCLPNGSVCDKIFKKDLFVQNKISFPKGRFWEDNATLIKLVFLCNRMSFINKVSYYYFLNKDSICYQKDTQQQKKRDEDRLYVARLIMDLMNEYHLSHRERKAVYDFILRAIGWDIETNKSLQDIVHYKKQQFPKSKKILKKVRHVFYRKKDGKIRILGIKIKKIRFKYLLQKLPVKKYRVLFWSMNGQGFGDNPKYIALEMLKHKKFELIWLYDKDKLRFKEEFPKGIKLVECHSLKALYYLATYNIFISNVRQNLLHKDELKKKKGQIYIHTWHGHLGFKKIEADYPKLPDFYIQMAQQDSSDIDYLSSGAEWSENRIFKQTFWYSGKYFRGGNPRNDILFHTPNHIKEKIYHYFGLSPTNKILMYAPTFRDNHNQNVYQIDYKGLKDALENKFPGEWVILSRLHPNMMTEENLLPQYTWLKDATKYPDMQELLCVTDILITDYSSSIFDFLITGRPGLIYATDKDYYERERGFMIRLEESPFPVAYNNVKLIENIKNLDVQKFAQTAKEFLKEKGSYDQGDASQKLVQFILKEL